jgi:hypothetical protein
MTMTMTDLTQVVGDVPHLALPPELHDLDEIREYERLRALHATAAVELRDLYGGEHAAREKDKQALAEAMSAGKTDPGDRHLAKLAEKINGQARKVNGLADAAAAVYADVRAVVGERREDLLADADSALGEARARLGDLLPQVAEAFDDAASARRLRAWVETATDPERKRGLPSLNSPTPSVRLGGTIWPRDEVLAALLVV